MTELQQFLAMLTRAGVGHGTRTDYNPPGTAVQVETDHGGGDGGGTPGFWVTEFAFDAAGNLTEVESYEGEEY